MTLSLNSSKQEQLLELAVAIQDKTPDVWLFPEEDVVKGFLGTGPIFIVGIRPSTNEWGPKHPRRRFFYNLLARIGASNAHLTDIYKRRGHSDEIEVESEKDFQEQLLFFRKEIEILRPTCVIALGHDAWYLLSQHTPELKPKLKRVRHFSWAVRASKLLDYEQEMRAALEVAELS